MHGTKIIYVLKIIYIELPSRCSAEIDILPLKPSQWTAP